MCSHYRLGGVSIATDTQVDRWLESECSTDSESDTEYQEVDTRVAIIQYMAKWEAEWEAEWEADVFAKIAEALIDQGLTCDLENPAVRNQLGNDFNTFTNDPFSRDWLRKHLLEGDRSECYWKSDGCLDAFVFGALWNQTDGCFLQH